MSKDEARLGLPFDKLNEEVQEAAPQKRKYTRKPKPAMTPVTTVRKHKVENVNRNGLAQALDAYAAEGRVVIALNISRDIGGCYECVSFKNEPVN
jgi:hypothetical protein